MDPSGFVAIDDSTGNGNNGFGNTVINYIPAPNGGDEGASSFNTDNMQTGKSKIPVGVVNPDLLSPSQSKLNRKTAGSVQQVGSAGGGVYRSGDTQSFDNGLGIEYDLQDGVGIRSSAQVQGYFSISQSGQVSVYAEVFHGEKNIPYTYNGNVRFTVNGKQTFIPLSLNGESSIYHSLYSPIGFANYGLPSSGTVTMEIYIGYEVNTGAGYFNGEYYNGTFILGR